MQTDSPTWWGLLAGLMFGLSAHAVNWFITPHPDVSTLRIALVAVQLIVAAAIGVWSWRRGKSLERGSGVETKAPAV
jgi:uncharacterized membrane protein YdcZ (DUF606 family)